MLAIGLQPEPVKLGRELLFEHTADFGHPALDGLLVLIRERLSGSTIRVPWAHRFISPRPCIRPGYAS
jgi:hypothetical protein